ncbi:MAG: hypothetical protein IKQ37_09410 [Bacteroidaceae bacterium]|nr:hypothetical protein [Bacteroidaceae bacterium]
MKQKFYYLLLTALLGMTGMNAWAQDYEITCAQDLIDFAEAVNGGETGANAVLANDIDMTGVAWTTPIGDWNTGAVTSAYCGHFDGQGHTISGLTYTTAKNYHGFFGVISTGALIENFTIYGTVANNQTTMGVVGYARDATPTIRNVHSYLNINNSKAGARLGGILGSSVNGTIVVENCTYSGTLDGNDAGGSGNYGGIVGYVNNNANAHLQVTNCLFDGQLINEAETPGTCTFGGIVGYVGASPDVTITNCLSIGTVQSQIYGQFYGAVKHNTCSIINSFYQGDKVNGAANGAVTPTTQEATEVTDAQLASGEIAFKLNGDQSDINWFQVLSRIFIAQDYVVTVNNGTPRDPEHTEVSLTEEGSGKYTFTLPNFVIHTNNSYVGDLEIGDLSHENITITDEGLFSAGGTFDVPDENIPSQMSMFASAFKNIPYELNGKVNNEDKLYATLDIVLTLTGLGKFTVFVEMGDDDFTAAAPLAAEPYPTPYGTSVVYANGKFYCDGVTPKEGSEITYSNTDGSIVDNHVFDNGFCTVCGALKENYMTADADGFFEIGTAAQLKWFAAYVNQKDVAANAKLTADIDLTGVEWTSIGIGSGNAAPGATAYTGTFDGQGKTITGFYAEGAGHLGLFGDVSGATIKDFSISGTLNVTGGYGGGVVAWPINSTIENVYSALVVSVPNSSTHHVGGVVGSARGGNTISGCTFSGSLTVVAGSTDNFAGIAAYITNGDNVINCANYGDVTFSDAGCAAGGIVGYVNAQQAYVQSCLSTGTILFDGEGTAKYGAAILGRTKGYDAAKVTNNYWLEGSANGAAKKDDGTDPLATGSVTAEQLASGEVAYKFGEAWSQFLGTDKVPVPGGVTPVSYIGEAGYATMYDTTSGYELNGDVTAYVATASGNWLVLTEIENVPVGTPVILKGGYYNKIAADLPAINIANDLLGTDVATEADGTQYILALAKPAEAEAEEIGFYKAETGTIIPAGKAYYKSTNGVKAFFFTEDDATGIAVSPLAETEEGATIFNLAGQRISKAQKGINIMNGKKILK